MLAPACASGSAASRRCPAAPRSTRSTSASVLAAPRLNRIEFCVRCGGKPIALSTCDGSSVPDEQAEPVDTAMPSRSSAISSDSASTRSKLMFVVFGTRGDARAVDDGARAPRRRMPSSSRSRSAARRARFLGHLRARQLGRDAHADDAGDVLGAGAAAALLLAAGHESAAAAARAGSRSRRRPSARRTCAPRATAGRRRAPSRRPGSCRPTARRRCGTARRARAPAAPARRSAEWCRSRCSRA